MTKVDGNLKFRFSGEKKRSKIDRGKVKKRQMKVQRNTKRRRS